MDSEVLQALCALAAVAVPLALAWWIAGRGERTAPAKEDVAEAQQERPRCYPLRSDL